MSTRNQEARALNEAWQFLLRLGSGEYPARPVKKLRAEARRVLRHYPLAAQQRWEAHRDERQVTEDMIHRAAHALAEHDNPGAYERGDAVPNYDEYVAAAARALEAAFNTTEETERRAKP